MSTVPQVNFGSYTSLFAFQNNTSESTNPTTTGGNSTPSTMTGYMPTGTMNNGYPYYNYSYGIILWLIQQSTLRLQPWTIWWTILTIWWIISTQCSPSPLLLQHPTLYVSSIPSWKDSCLNKNSLLPLLMCVIVAIKLATGFNSVL